MGVTDYIKSISMEVDEKYNNPNLVAALDLYHSLVKENVIKPRENQLNSSGSMPSIIRFNSKI